MFALTSYVFSYIARSVVDHLDQGNHSMSCFFVCCSWISERQVRLKWSLTLSLNESRIVFPKTSCCLSEHFNLWLCTCVMSAKNIWCVNTSQKKLRTTLRSFRCVQDVYKTSSRGVVLVTSKAYITTEIQTRLSEVRHDILMLTTSSSYAYTHLQLQGYCIQHRSAFWKNSLVLFCLCWNAPGIVSESKRAWIAIVWYMFKWDVRDLQSTDRCVCKRLNVISVRQCDF